MSLEAVIQENTAALKALHSLLSSGGLAVATDTVRIVPPIAAAGGTNTVVTGTGSTAKPAKPVKPVQAEAAVDYKALRNEALALSGNLVKGGKQPQVAELLSSYGAARFSELADDKLADYLERAKALQGEGA